MQEQEKIRVRFAYSNSSLCRCWSAGTPSSSAETNSLKIQPFSLSTSSFYATTGIEKQANDDRHWNKIDAVPHW